MDITHENPVPVQEDTIMDATHAHAHHVESQATAHPTLHDTAAVSAGMDVDSHMGDATAGSSIEFTLMHTETQQAPQSIPQQPTVEPTAKASAAVETTSMMDTSNLEDRLDAVIAGGDDKSDGYESSDLESSGDDDDEPDSSDSDSDSDSDGHAHSKSALTLEQREKALIEIEAMDDDEDASPSAILHTTNEILELPKVEKPNIELGLDVVLTPFGSVMSIVDNVVVVQAHSSGEVSVLDSGTVTAVVTPAEGDQEAVREVLGEIFETFGPVARPLYSIRFNTSSEIPAQCKIGSTVYSIPAYSSIIMTAPLKAMKGSDASNKFDEEVDDVELEFSDDEKEMEHKRMLKSAKNKKRGGAKERKPSQMTDTAAAYQSQGSSSNSAPRQIIALPPRPTFDEPEDGYRILQRPGVMARPSPAQSASAGTGTVPWYQQQQRELQNMMGTNPNAHQQQQQHNRQQQQFQQQQQLQQQLLLQQQQQRQLFEQQQQQQALYQQQIQEAQATISRLQQQQHQLQQQSQQTTAAPSQAFQFRSPQQLDTSYAPSNPSFNPQVYQPQVAPSFQPQDPAPSNQEPNFQSMLSPLFPQQQQQNDQNPPQ
ncbi:MAG: Gar1/Naf1 RNA binding region-domain-containing protein [Linnemannia elongata]|nr:MAG: Gar1/Naf1 RNA binding region-domain-containing protein [Linnemannia elongata]